MTKGQTEDAIAKSVTKFYFKILGVGPRETRVYILSDMIIIRLKGKLLPIEERLLQNKNGVELVKNIRQLLHESTVNGITKIISQITAHHVMSSHSDISTKSGEIFQVYILDKEYEDEFADKAG